MYMEQETMICFFALKRLKTSAIHTELETGLAHKSSLYPQ
jgi:hypothetical protein